MNNKYTEDGSSTEDCNCPHCFVYIDESELDDVLEFENYTEFDCPHCKKRIKGIMDFEAFSADVEYHLSSLIPVTNTAERT